MGIVTEKSRNVRIWKKILGYGKFRKGPRRWILHEGEKNGMVFRWIESCLFGLWNSTNESGWILLDCRKGQENLSPAKKGMNEFWTLSSGMRWRLTFLLFNAKFYLMFSRSPDFENHYFTYFIYWKFIKVLQTSCSIL